MRSVNVVLTLLTIAVAQAPCFAGEGEFISINDPDSIDGQGWSGNYGGYIKNRLIGEQEFDLEKHDREDFTSNKLEFGFNFLLEKGRQFDLYFETELSRLGYLHNETNKSEKGWELAIEEVYFDISDEKERFTLRYGRQTFEDEMEWFYDANLDGLRIFYKKKKLAVEFSLTEEDSFDGNYLNAERDKNEKIKNVVMFASYAAQKKYSFSGYLISRNEKVFDGNRPEDLFISGIQSVGKINKNLKHWLNLAYVTGTRERSNETRDIQAYGFDVGVTIIGNSSWEPSFTLGYAYGSGDARRNEGKDGNFRQTGLQDNYYRFNGVTKFKYLGEIFDPEITNITIATLGLGLRPTKSSSIDIVYHVYEQDEVIDRLTGTNIDRDPQGENNELGTELDIIIGAKGKNVYVEGILAVFDPGIAFNSDANNAYLLSLEVGMKF